MDGVMFLGHDAAEWARLRQWADERRISYRVSVPLSGVDYRSEPEVWARHVAGLSGAECFRLAKQWDLQGALKEQSK